MLRMNPELPLKETNSGMVYIGVIPSFPAYRTSKTKETNHLAGPKRSPPLRQTHVKQHPVGSKAQHMFGPRTIGIQLETGAQQYPMAMAMSGAGVGETPTLLAFLFLKAVLTATPCFSLNSWAFLFSESNSKPDVCKAHVIGNPRISAHKQKMIRRPQRIERSVLISC